MSQLTPVSFLADATSCAAAVVGFSHRMLREAERMFEF